MSYTKRNFLYFIAIFLGLTAVSGSLVYRLYSLNFFGTVLCLLFAFSVFLIIVYFYRKSNKFSFDSNKNNNQKIDKEFPASKQKVNYLLFTIYCLLVVFCLWILWQHRVDGSINSPWNVVPAYFFVFYFFTALNLFFIVSKNFKFKLLAVSLFYFLSFSIALIVYKIGYGFDPFIHQATLELIDKQGFVNPKPFYYLGQYSLEIIFHRLSFIPIVWIDKFLVPFLASLFLPFFIYNFSARFLKEQRAWLLPLLFLVIPVSWFIVTTPQNLAYLFLIFTIFAGLTAQKKIDLAGVFIFALASLAIQPIAGIPAFFYAVLITLYQVNFKYRKIFSAGVIFLSSLSLPLAFYFVQARAGGSVVFNWRNFDYLKEFFLDFIPQIPGRENFVLNFIYFYAFNLKTIIIFLILFGLFLAYRRREIFGKFFLNLALAGSLIIAYVFSGFLAFDYLINYERADFLNRILIALVIVLSPFIAITFAWIGDRVWKQNLFVKSVSLLFLALLLTTSLYLIYPRQDRYEFSHIYAVGKNELDAVRWIEKTAEGKKYIVLANQQVSASALREFGFSRYLGQDEVYFYPIPTSSPLYEYYLKMVYEKPSQKNIQTAMDLAGVDLGYFVLNKYWTDFPKILAEAKFSADSWQEMGGGEIYIFEYRK